MKYLVTGAAGFIGARVAEFLLQDGHHVVGVDNLNDYYDCRLKIYRLAELSRLTKVEDSIIEQLNFKENSKVPKTFEGERFWFVAMDIESLPDCKKLFDEHKFDAVLNLAARAGVRYSLENPHIYLNTNTNANLNLLDLMKKHECKKMVLASTSSLYAGLKMPFTEDLPTNTPISPYAATKKGAEAMCYSYHHLYDMDITVLRYFTVFGPAGRPDMSIFR